ncbi:MAG: bifunctional 4-hydroxy-2-oxoglutarate aldolase/2-dehydro-3-deoxy-phosphogluconate aldolase [Aquisalimonadaceae bacterium]
MDIRSILARAPVIPVISIEDPRKAVPLARALVAGGLPVLEITLRTARAFEAVERIVAEVPEALVGVGTIQRPEEMSRSAALGACFAVSPGLTPELASAARDVALPLLPGVMTPSEVMRARGAGYLDLKLFPAAPAGGSAMLKALGGPFPDVRFCPTGGVRPATMLDYLSLNNVPCVGGTWLTPVDAVTAEDWARITGLAMEACAMAARLGDTGPSEAEAGATFED